MSRTEGRCKGKKEEEQGKRSVSRRDFLGALGISSAGVMLGACAKGKTPVDPSAAPAVVPSASAAGRGARLDAALSRVATANVTSYDRTVLRRNLESMFDAIGGLSDICPAGATVGLKVNLTGGSSSGNVNAYKVPPCELYWTHPDVVRVTGELFKDAGAGQIYIVEAVYDWNSYNNYGFKDAADYLGATLIDLNAKAPYADYVQRPVGEGWLIYENLTQNAILNDIQCMVSFPKSKQHKGAGLTHSMKMLVGSLPVPSGLYNAGQGHRAALHQHRVYDNNPDSNLRRVIIDLNKATRIHLAVNDAIKTTLGSEGPWNRDLRPVSFNKLIVSKDIVAADSVSTQVIGFDPMAADNTGPWVGGINYFKLAQEKGLGTYDLSHIEVVDATAATGVRDRRPLGA